MVTLTHNKQHYKNVRHQATRRAQIWLNRLPHLDAIHVLFISIPNEDPVKLTSIIILRHLQIFKNRIDIKKKKFISTFFKSTM